MQNIKSYWLRLPGSIRKTLTAIAGGVVILVGILLLFLPGPGWLVIFFGLAILAAEFPVADRIRVWILHHFKSALASLRKDKANHKKPKTTTNKKSPKS